MMALRARYGVQADPLRSERRVELALLGCVVLLLLVGAYLLVRVVLATDVAPIAPAPDSVRVATLAGRAPLPLEEREAILARPLFWAGRVPEEVPQEPAAIAEAEQRARAAPKMKGVTVRGVYGSGDTGGVILSVKERELRVAVGDEVEGWRLERVTGNSAVFVSGAERDERELLPQVVEAPPPPAADRATKAAPAPDGGEAAEAAAEGRLSLGGVPR
jgi:hypothetical protein